MLLFLLILFYVCCFKSYVQKVVHPELVYLFLCRSIIRHVKKGDTVFVLSFFIQSYRCIPRASDHRVLYSAKISFQSSDLGPPPLTRKGVLLLLPLGPRRETHSLAGEGWGPNSDKGTDTLILCVYYISLIYSPDADFLLMLVRCCVNGTGQE